MSRTFLIYFPCLQVLLSWELDPFIQCSGNAIPSPSLGHPSLGLITNKNAEPARWELLSLTLTELKTVLNTFQPLGIRRHSRYCRAFLSHLLSLKLEQQQIPQTCKQLSHWHFKINPRSLRGTGGIILHSFSG